MFSLHISVHGNMNETNIGHFVHIPPYHTYPVILTFSLTFVFVLFSFKDQFSNKDARLVFLITHLGTLFIIRISHFAMVTLHKTKYHIKEILSSIQISD